jgi:hypothetical protein
MCLEIVKEVYAKPLRGIGRGYKAFCIGCDGNIDALLQRGPTGGYKIGQWYESYVAKGEQRVLGDLGHTYPPGFHIHSNKEAADAWQGTTFIVEYDRVIAAGEQEEFETIIALDMRIVERCG